MGHKSKLCPKKYSCCPNEGSKSIFYSSGMMMAQRMYTSKFDGINIKSILTNTGEIPKNSANPPHTPARIRSVLDLLNFLPCMKTPPLTIIY